MTSTAVILFSGGMDSTVAYFAARENYDKVHALSFNYAQRHLNEITAAGRVWAKYGNGGEHYYIDLPRGVVQGKSSLLHCQGITPVAEYDDAQQAQEGMHSDPSYIPLRNSIFISIAANWLLGRWSPDGGDIIVGTRDSPGGYADCSTHFRNITSSALQQGCHKRIAVVSPLDDWMPGRAGSLALAWELPECWEALALTMTCYKGSEPPCGRCLPCVRRADGFAKFGQPDPLLQRLSNEGKIV